MEILEILCKELNIRRTQAEAAVKLLDDGNTVPFIARYRKEATGGLDDDQLRALTGRGKPRRIPILHQFLFILQIACLDLPHRCQNCLFRFIRCQKL